LINEIVSILMFKVKKNLYQLGLYSFILCFCVFSIFNVTFAKDKKNTWKKVKIDKIIDNKHFLLFDQRVIKIIGVDVPDLIKPSTQDQCYAKNIFRILKILLENKEVKILQDDIFKEKNGIFPRHVKLDSNENLAEFMIENGLARFESDGINTKFDKKFIKAEQIAKDQKIVLWNKCGLDQSRIFTKHKAGIARQNFNKKYAQFLAPISVGKVQKVLSGQDFVLENGLKIKLLGIETPYPEDLREGFSCFGTQSKNYLEKLILGNKVHLVRDFSQLNSSEQLIRYVFLPAKNKNEQEIFVNEKMIQDGYAQSFWDSKKDDNYFQKEFNNAQEKIWKDLQGAWLYCATKIADLKNNDNSNQKTETKKLEFDPNCRIKGNISGSKKNPIKKYHTPASRWYKNLQHEKCFETEEAAKKDGFVKVK